MSLHDRIINLRGSSLWAVEFLDGYRQGRQEAAQLAKEADQIMEDQFDIIKAFYIIAEDNNWHQASQRIDAALTYYKNWKEQAKWLTVIG